MSRNVQVDSRRPGFGCEIRGVDTDLEVLHTNARAKATKISGLPSPWREGAELPESHMCPFFLSLQKLAVFQRMET